ncbi:hypothetical protein PLESTF_001105300 [Pleodorina starrii]|nr:hypothetical protein PLESTM_001748800 [Pleodorina starrii]GLC71344.1 hypothetical protein PLESTF_001105300 [Pleodorina starrii]
MLRSGVSVSYSPSPSVGASSSSSNSLFSGGRPPLLRLRPVSGPSSASCCLYSTPCSLRPHSLAEALGAGAWPVGSSVGWRRTDGQLALQMRTGACELGTERRRCTTA